MFGWAGLAQLEKFANETKVEGFGPRESLSFAWSSTVSSTPNPHEASHMCGLLKSVGCLYRVKKDHSF